MNPYELERLAAQRQADYIREAHRAAAGLRARPLGVAMAGVLRGAADWLDGGRSDDRRRIGGAPALD